MGGNVPTWGLVMDQIMAVYIIRSRSTQLINRPEVAGATSLFSQSMLHDRASDFENNWRPHDDARRVRSLPLEDRVSSSVMGILSLTSLLSVPCSSCRLTHTVRLSQPAQLESVRNTQHVYCETNPFHAHCDKFSKAWSFTLT